MWLDVPSFHRNGPKIFTVRDNSSMVQGCYKIMEKVASIKFLPYCTDISTVVLGLLRYSSSHVNVVFKKAYFWHRAAVKFISGKLKGPYYITMCKHD